MRDGKLVRLRAALHVDDCKQVVVVVVAGLHLNEEKRQGSTCKNFPFVGNIFEITVMG